MEGSKKMKKNTKCMIATLVCFLTTCFPGFSWAAEEISIFRERLPAISIECDLAGDTGNLRDSLTGRPVVIFVTNVHHGTDNPLGRFLAMVQEEYFYWFNWSGLLVGPAAPGEIERIYSSSPFRIERCLRDKEENVWHTLDLKSLPALLLVNEEGYIVRKVENYSTAKSHEIISFVDDLIRSSDLEGKAARDFKLPDTETGKLTSLLDVAGKKFTFLIFLRTKSARSLNELQMLQHIRNTYKDEVTLVAIFQDPSTEEEIWNYLDTYEVTPDFTLHDPRMHQAQSYSFHHVPVLLVVGPDGKIILEQKGYEPAKSWYLTTELDSLFKEKKKAATGDSLLRARQVYTEAIEYLEEEEASMGLVMFNRVLEIQPGLSTVHRMIADTQLFLGNKREAAQHYSRYISANPQAYDLPQVKRKLRTLAEKPSQQ